MFMFKNDIEPCIEGSDVVRDVVIAFRLQLERLGDLSNLLRLIATGVFDWRQGFRQTHMEKEVVLPLVQALRLIRRRRSIPPFTMTRGSQACGSFGCRWADAALPVQPAVQCRQVLR